MEENTLFFFNKRPEAIPLYEVFESRLLSELEGVVIQPQKSQITLKNRPWYLGRTNTRVIWFPSWLPVPTRFPPSSSKTLTCPAPIAVNNRSGLCQSTKKSTQP